MAKDREDIMSPNMRKFIENWVFDMPNASPMSMRYNVVPKISKLVQVLQQCQLQDSAFRGVVVGMLRGS